ncbi:SET domain-containing protein-lysine N-methyltransferase, partial [archaeon]
ILYFESDLSSLDMAQLDYIQDTIYLVHSSVQQQQQCQQQQQQCQQQVYGDKAEVSEDRVLLEPESWQGGPIFRVTAMDNVEQPIFAKSLETLYAHITMLVRRCREVQQVEQGSKDKEGKKGKLGGAILVADRRAGAARARAADCVSFGLTGHQFFGLGIPVVRRAIEQLPGSISCMVHSTEDLGHGSSHLDTSESFVIYQPSFCMPSAKAVVNYVNMLQNLNKSATKTSLSGASRSEVYVDRSKQQSVEDSKAARNKLLSKAVDLLDNSTLSKSAADEYDVDVELENNKAQEELRRQKYLAMSRAYLQDPNARLEVRRSRIHNWGLFARIGFEKDDIIVEYIGQKIRTVVADKREAQYEREGVGSCYLFRLDKEEIVDATRTGGMARFMNHCCEPNAYARVISNGDGPDASKHIVIIAARDIKVVPFFHF